MAQNRIVIVEEEVSVRRTYLIKHRHVTRPAQVLLSPRARDRADLTVTRLRIGTVIAMMLLSAFAAGASM
jgi:hypothetical protein